MAIQNSKPFYNSLVTDLEILFYTHYPIVKIVTTCFIPFPNENITRHEKIRSELICFIILIFTGRHLNIELAKPMKVHQDVPQFVCRAENFTFSRNLISSIHHNNRSIVFVKQAQSKKAF